MYVRLVFTGAGLGAMAKTFIQRNTWLGEYDGEVIKPENEHLVTDYGWQSYLDEILTHYVDGARIATSNWLRWVNCPRTTAEENVKPIFCFGKVYYMTIKDIYPSQELFCYYGDDYATSLGIKPFNED